MELIEMSSLKYQNNYIKNRSQGIRFKLEQNFLNKLVYFFNTEIRPVFRGLIRARAGMNNKYFTERYSEMKHIFQDKAHQLAIEHFTGILKLSLTDKYGAWHKVPKDEVSMMLNKLMKQAKINSKINYISRRMFSQMKPLFSPTLKEMREDEFIQNSIRSLMDIVNKNMSAFGGLIYTQSTYFMNSAYEIQFRTRDPENKFIYIWGTRPDNRRTPQCAMIESKVEAKMKKDKVEGLSLDDLKKIVTDVANMEGFKNANPYLSWTPHYGCRSGIERII